MSGTTRSDVLNRSASGGGGGGGPGGGAITSSGTATLVNGAVTVSSTYALTSSVYLLTNIEVIGIQGTLSIGTIVNATSFVINSSSGVDNSVIGWAIK